MNTLKNLSFYEANVIVNIRTTAMYLYDAVKEMDLESAKLELEELAASLKFLEEVQEKKAHRERLENLVKNMRKRGIIIDFASRIPLLKMKNAADGNQLQSHELIKN